MKIRKEVKIGGVMLLCIFLAIWGANYLKGKNIFDKSLKLYAVYDNVGGLSRTNPVMFNGNKVGQVESVDFSKDFSGKLIVQFSINEQFIKIPRDSKAEIFSDGFLGGKAINLAFGTSETSVKNLDTLSSSIEASLQDAVNQQIAPLKNKAEDLIGSIDSAITTVKSIFNTKAQEDIGSSITNIRQSLEVFKRTMEDADAMVNENRQSLSRIFSNVESITQNFENNNKKLDETLSNLKMISDSLAGANLQQTVNNASIAMQEVAELMQKVNNGEGSLGALMNNDTLYRNLEAAAYDLDQLMLDMRLNPERYVHFSIFGRKDKKGN
ncbi:MAG: phospholipid/cholesterol/gamma-HCH transport system substrate-binding protein [Vicingaceae bacterium]|jgi:phospholipid/cholesterol/gamma-HCH transport system substrate-binding protein